MNISYLIRGILKVIAGALVLIFGTYYFPILMVKWLSHLPHNMWVQGLRLCIIFPSILIGVWGISLILVAMDDFHR